MAKQMKEKDDLEKQLQEIGSRIRALRKKNGITQLELADKVGCSETHLSNIETGSAKMGVDIAIRIAEYFGVTTDWILRAINPELTDKIGANMAELLSDCSPSEREYYEDMLGSIKVVSRKHGNKGK